MGQIRGKSRSFKKVFRLSSDVSGGPGSPLESLLGSVGVLLKGRSLHCAMGIDRTSRLEVAILEVLVGGVGPFDEGLRIGPGSAHP